MRSATLKGVPKITVQRLGLAARTVRLKQKNEHGINSSNELLCCYFDKELKSAFLQGLPKVILQMFELTR